MTTVARGEKNAPCGVAMSQPCRAGLRQREAKLPESCRAIAHHMSRTIALGNPGELRVCPSVAQQVPDKFSSTCSGSRAADRIPQGLADARHNLAKCGQQQPMFVHLGASLNSGRFSAACSNCSKTRRHLFGNFGARAWRAFGNFRVIEFSLPQARLSKATGMTSMGGRRRHLHPLVNFLRR